MSRISHGSCILRIWIRKSKDWLAKLGETVRMGFYWVRLKVQHIDKNTSTRRNSVSFVDFKNHKSNISRSFQRFTISNQREYKENLIWLAPSDETVSVRIWSFESLFGRSIRYTSRSLIIFRTSFEFVWYDIETQSFVQDLAIEVIIRLDNGIILDKSINK